MSISGRETLPNVREWWEALEDVRELLRGKSWMSGSCREAIPGVQEWLESLPDIWELLGAPLGCP